MQRTKIQYLTHTWNPIAMRCTPCSPGCADCWHLGYADRFKNNPIFSQEVRDAYAGGKPELLIKELDAPLHLRKPAVIGVQFMGDLFHPDVPDEYIYKIFGVMAKIAWQKYLILTKQPERMLTIIHALGEKDAVDGRLIWKYAKKVPYGKYIHPDGGAWNWPLNNLILGISICTQPEADKKIPILLQIPAAKRIISFEPLLEGYMIISLKGVRFNQGICEEEKIDQVIIGCESGPKRRPCKLEWVRSIVEQCKAAGVGVFVKQLDIDGKVSHDMNEWPEDLRIQNPLIFTNQTRAYPRLDSLVNLLVEKE